MIKRFPGLIDVHVHLREPGATHKEDFLTGTRAAVVGGFTYVLDMPNNLEPTVTMGVLEEKLRLSDEKALCRVGFFFGTNGKNTAEFSGAFEHPRVFGLKLYCNHTTGEMLIEELELLEKVFDAWESNKPILVHAEGVELAAALSLAQLYNRRLHVCHISQAMEVELVGRAKKRGWQVTAGVCPHHLFLTSKDRERLGPKALMKPPLGSKTDQTTLRAALAEGVIDIVETDHAPHTLKEKQSDSPPFGVPGLEEAVGLVYRGVVEGWLPEHVMQRVFHDRAKEIFGIPDQANTYMEVDTERLWMVGENGYQSKCGWSPYTGWELPAKVKTVVIEGETKVDNYQLVEN